MPLAAAEVVPAAALLVGQKTVQVVELAPGQVTDPVVVEVDLMMREQHQGMSRNLRKTAHHYYSHDHMKDKSFNQLLSLCLQ